jgi:hypothetical protein
MKRKFFQSFFRIPVALILTGILQGCSGYFDNPLKDKETGEDIHLLILDFNFFNTRIAVKLLDAADGQLITTPATIRFSGANGDDIVTYTGNKKEQFTTTEGQIEVAVDPNISIVENAPFHFTIAVEAEGYNILSKSFQYTSEGKKTIELNLSGISDEEETELPGGMDVENGDTSFVFFVSDIPGVKSVNTDEVPVQVNYRIGLDDFLKFKDTEGNLLFQSSEEVISAYNANPETFVLMSISRYSDYPPEIEVVNMDGVAVSMLFHKLETGKLLSLQVDGVPVADLNGGVIRSWCEYSGTEVPDLFGFAEFLNDSWDILGTEVVYDHLNFNYTVVEASAESLCPAGSSITFQSDVISSFSIDADVYDSDDKLLTTYNFKGSFPETFTVENTPNRAVKLVFRNNNPAFQPVDPLYIPDFCTGNYEVNVLPSEGYLEYQVVLKAFCPDNPKIAVAPTYSGEFKIKESNAPWQGVDMVGGVVDLLGLPNAEYQLRMLWENEWEYSTLFTEFDGNGNYLHPNGSKIYSEKLPDGRIRINIEHTYSQDVCDDFGW